MKSLYDGVFGKSEEFVNFGKIIKKMNKSGDKELLQVDLDRVLRNKAGKRQVPKFVVSLLKWIVREDFINEFLQRHHGKEGLDWSHAFLKEFNIKTKTYGEDNIPENGRFVFAANHPLGGTESHVFMSVVGRHFSHIKFPVNDVLMNIRPMQTIFVPVNKFGGQNKDSIRILNETFASDAQILIFPSGMASRMISGEIQDLEWKKTFITKAIQHKRDVIPVFIEGRNSMFFYRLAKLRKFLGIKFNVEMLFLPREVLKQRGRTICLHFGKPISWEHFDNSRSHKEWAKYVREKVYAMKPDD